MGFMNIAGSVAEPLGDLECYLEDRKLGFVPQSEKACVYFYI